MSQRQAKAFPYIDQGFGERVDQYVTMAGRRRDAQTLGAARDGRIVDGLDVDAVFVEQEVARLPARLPISRLKILISRNTHSSRQWKNSSRR